MDLSSQQERLFDTWYSEGDQEGPASQADMIFHS